MASSSVRLSRSTRADRPASVSPASAASHPRRLEMLDRLGPLLVGAGPARLEDAGGDLAARVVHDQRLAAGKLLRHQSGDVAVAAELAQLR